jgi:release factor glutamine methyltransferase
MPETLGSILDEVAAALLAGGCGEARRHARWLITAALGVGSAELLARPQREIAAPQSQHIRRLLWRVLSREPVSRVLGRREFWGIEFALSADTLDPRPESEAVAEAVLRRIPRRYAPLRILDLGTGTGCLLLSLLAEFPAAIGIGVDVAAGAAATARMNAAALGFVSRTMFLVGDWGRALSGRFAVVVANPPYIVRSALAGLPQEVQGYDPRRALDGGADGLAAHRRIATDLPRLLTSDGIFATEIGVGQADAVAAMLRDVGLAVEVEHDLAGNIRCVVGRPDTRHPRLGAGRGKKMLECAITPSRVGRSDTSGCSALRRNSTPRVPPRAGAGIAMPETGSRPLEIRKAS